MRTVKHFVIMLTVLISILIQSNSRSEAQSTTMPSMQQAEPKREHEPATGTLTGQVVDKKGAAITGARILLFSEKGRIVDATEVDPNGSYRFEHIPVGKYIVNAETSQFVPKKVSVELYNGQSFQNQIELQSVKAYQHEQCPLCVVLGPVGKLISKGPPQDFEPVYNAILSPSEKDDHLHVYSGAETSLKFYLGPADLDNALALGAIAINSRIKEAKSDLPLIITVSCGACPSNAAQQQYITYFKDHKVSSIAAFSFNFDRNMSDHGLSFLSIDVGDTAGNRFDHLLIDVDIKDGEPAPGSGPQATPLAQVSVSRLDEVRPDVTILLSSVAGNGIEVIVTPQNKDLIALLNKKYLLKETEDLQSQKARIFYSNENGNNFTIGEMDRYSHDTALQLKAITDPMDEDLKKLFESLPDGKIEAKIDRDTLRMSDQDREMVLQSFLKYGSTVYRRLFNDTDNDLAAMIDQIENFSVKGRPVRLLVKTKGVSFPWQFLHKPVQDDAGVPGSNAGKINAQDFWGMRFALAVDIQGLPAEGLNLKNSSPREGYSVFGVYNSGQGAQTSDFIVSRLSHLQAQRAKDKLNSDMTIDESRKAFVDDLSLHHSEISFVGIYAHGSSGFFLQPRAGGGYQDSNDSDGAKLTFAPNTDLRATDISRLPQTSRSADFFSSRPIIILNACETGSVNLLIDGLTLPRALLNVGARSVIATEAPVWSPFAYGFGNDLMEKMSPGTELSETLTQLRRDYLGSLNNPLGLLYSYYGYPTVIAKPLDKK